jgi:hypothetical protein
LWNRLGRKFADEAVKYVQVLDQGCQMVYLQTKNTNLGKFWRVLQ